MRVADARGKAGIVIGYRCSNPWCYCGLWLNGGWAVLVCIYLLLLAVVVVVLLCVSLWWGREG